MSDEITQFIECHRLDHGYPVLAQTLRSNHLTMLDAWDGLSPDHLVYLATLPNVLSQEELIRFGVWAIREIPDWQDADKDMALALIEKHAASDPTAEADEDRTTANGIAGILSEGVPCTSPGGASYARLALQHLANAGRTDRSRDYIMPPVGAVKNAINCVRGALGLISVPRHFAAWIRAYTTPHLYVTYPPQPSSGWRVKAPPGKVQALQTQAGPPPPSEPPVRLCCGQRHSGVACPDGKIMCSLCHHRFIVEELNTTDDGGPENVCKGCARMESMERVEAAAAEYSTARRAMEGARQELKAAALAYLRKCDNEQACRGLPHTLFALGVAVPGLGEHVTLRCAEIAKEGGTNV